LVDGLVGIDPSVPFYQATVDYWSQLQLDRIPKTREFVRSIFKQPQADAYFEKLTETALRTPTNTVMTLMDNYILQDFRPLLPRITTPTLIATVQGPRLGYMQAMQTMLPNARLELFESAGHALFVDQPERFNRVLESFIKSL
jgi:microsomal epoxide hydrolase